MDTQFFRAASYAAQRKIINPKKRDAVSDLVGKFKPKADSVLPSSLYDNGFHELGQVLRPDEVDSVKELLGDGPLIEPYDRGLKPFSLAAVPKTAHLGQYSRDAVIRIPRLLTLANQSDVLAKAAATLGCKPTLSDLLVWWSFPGPELPVDSQLWHRDRADWKMVKFFVYLTDVDLNTGPHVYASDTVNGQELVELRRFSDEEVKSKYPGHHVFTATGKAGTAFMTNPQGLHRASLPVEKPRLVFEATYSINALPKQNFEPLGYTPMFAQDRPSELDPWVNRLWYK